MLKTKKGLISCEIYLVFVFNWVKKFKKLGLDAYYASIKLNKVLVKNFLNFKKDDSNLVLTEELGVLLDSPLFTFLIFVFCVVV